MRFLLFSSDGRWLLTPEFMLPPASASRSGLPIPFGFVDGSELSAEERISIEESIESDFYAIVADHVIARLRPAMATRLGVVADNSTTA